MIRYHVPHELRCRAMVMSRKRAGSRCPWRAAADGLCGAHGRWGAVVPDDWTQPDNLPVWHVPAGIIERSVQ